MIRLLAATLAAIATFGIAGVHAGAADPPPITASFDDSLGVVTVTGSDDADTIFISTNATGAVLVNAGSVVIAGVPPTMNNTVLVAVDGRGGQDNISFSTTTPVPDARIDGGDSSDVLRAGTSPAVINGGEGNDFVVGGVVSDWIDLGPGDDAVLWLRASGSDHIDGRDGGFDHLLLNGNDDSETVDINPNAGRVSIASDNGETLDIDEIEFLSYRAFGGADTFNIGDVAAEGLLTFNVGLVGSNGLSDTYPDHISLSGSEGNDAVTVSGPAPVTATGTRLNVDGGSSADIDTVAVNTGLGDDTIDASNLVGGIVQLTVDAGVGTNTVVGSAGIDTAHFPGTIGNDDATLAGEKGHAILDDDNGRTDLDGVETVEYIPFAGMDAFTVADLKGTDVTQVNADLSIAPGTNTPDGVTDTVRVLGTNKGDDIGAVPDTAGAYHVTGLAAGLRVTGNEDTWDQFFLDGLGGNDALGGSTLPLRVRIDGGTGNDDIRGGSHADDLVGGGGNDTFRWSPGDGNDVIEGINGSDELRYDGANVSEYIGVSRIFSHVQLYRGVASELVEIGGVEKVTVNTYGGTDTVSVDDLAGTEVNIVNIDANGAPTGDGAGDTIAAFGTERADNVTVKTTGNGATISGLAARINVASGEFLDLFHFFGGNGNDRFNASKLADTTAQLWIEGGAGNDTITGGQGSDALVGDEDDDRIRCGAGFDYAEGGTGTDTAADDCEIKVDIP